MLSGNQSIEELQNIIKNINKNNTSQSNVIDWESRKKWWLGKINEFYSDIEKWCKEINVKVDKFDIVINEKNIGSYTTKKMVLFVGEKNFLFVPVGTIIIGGRGRIDIIYGSSRKKLILFAKGELEKVNKVNNEVLSKIYKDPEPKETEWYLVDTLGKHKKLFDHKAFLEFLVENMEN